MRAAVAIDGTFYTVAAQVNVSARTATAVVCDKDTGHEVVSFEATCDALGIVVGEEVCKWSSLADLKQELERRIHAGK